MKPLSKSEKQIIWYDSFILGIYGDFCKKLLRTQQVKNKKGYYFQKSSNLPKNTIFLKSFLKANYAYEDFDYIMKLYQFISSEFDKISINAFYNLCKFLDENNIYSISSNELYDSFEKSKNRLNDLDNIKTIIQPLKFLKSTEKKQNG